MNLSQIVLIGLCVVGMGIVRADQWDFFGGCSWDEKYISQGRDNLEEGGLFSGDMTFSDGYNEIGLWYGVADSVDYSELNVGLSHRFEWSSVDCTLSLTHLYFFEEEADDQELAITVGVEELGGWAPLLALVYSHEAEGFFCEIGMESEYEVGDHLAVTPYGILSLNDGYVGGEPEGLNSFQAGAVISYGLSDSLTLSASLSYSIGIAEGVEDILWGGVRFDL